MSACWRGTLVVNLKRVNGPGTTHHDQDLSSELIDLLALYQEEAATTETPKVTHWKHEDKSLKIHPHGTAAWKWLLKNGFVDVLLGLGCIPGAGTSPVFQ